MIKEQTLIVLGAGASRHYGFPTGAGLIDEIVSKCSRPIAGVLNDEFHIRDILKVWRFGKLLQKYDPASIDQFLTLFSNDKLLAELGKKLITHTIIQHQNPHSITRNNKENWYKFLFESIFDGISFADFLKSDFPCDVITFNYDLSFEYFVQSKLKLLPDLEAGIREKVFEKIYSKIHHVYGSVYDFKTILNQYTPHNSTDEYNVISGWCAAAKSSYFDETQRHFNNIKIIGEERQDIPALKKITMNAERIFILGFGFDDQNMRYLGLDKLRHSDRCKELFSTNYRNSRIISEKIKKIVRENVVLNISDKTVFDALCTDFSFL